jgi:hypothetical protein
MVVVMAETGAETSDDSSSDNSTTSSECEENAKVRCVGTESEEEEDDSSSTSSATESQSSSASDESESDTSDLPVNAGKLFNKIELMCCIENECANKSYTKINILAINFFTLQNRLQLGRKIIQI